MVDVRTARPKARPLPVCLVPVCKAGRASAVLVRQPLQAALFRQAASRKQNNLLLRAHTPTTENATRRLAYVYAGRTHTTVNRRLAGRHRRRPTLVRRELLFLSAWTSNI